VRSDPNNELWNIAVNDGTKQSHNMNEIYNVRLYQATDFLNAPRISTSHVFQRFKDFFFNF